jgi:hypothetical protein
LDSLFKIISEFICFTANVFIIQQVFGAHR